MSKKIYRPYQIIICCLLLKYIKLPEIKNSKNPVKKAIEKVAEKLHNTYHICLKSYINPILIEKLKNKN